MKIIMTLNGGPDNPWHVYGFRCNPFPQIARYEFRVADRILQDLDSDPLQSTDDIRHILAGCDPEFIDGVCQRFVPGKRVRFEVSWPEGA